MVQILFTVFRMGHRYENAQIIHNHVTPWHTTIVLYMTNSRVQNFSSVVLITRLCIKPFSSNDLNPRTT